MFYIVAVTKFNWRKHFSCKFQNLQIIGINLRKTISPRANDASADCSQKRF